MIWMETPTPSLDVAKKFSDGVHKYKPNLMLAYNLSPSFNWEKENMTNDDLEMFTSNLAQLGYCWQFITLAGFHMSALISEVFTRNFSKHGMLSYVQTIQRQEKIEGVDQLLHQKWSGANLKDREVEIASAGKASTKANQTNGESTENQFRLKSNL